MLLTPAIQFLSLAVLYVAGAALVLDFVKARRELTKALVTWREQREEPGI
jgi:hypothetical protein